MKDQYAGDVNDFFKYQLLRISRAHFRSLLVVWMLTAADGRSDGGQMRYLEDPRSRQLDPELHEMLAALVAAGGRSVGAIERSRILDGCEFVSGPMPVAATDRAEYFRSLALRASVESLVFFDPDNGFEVPSVPMHRRGAERYLFWDELCLIREAGASVLVYQHFPRVQRQKYLDALLSRLRVEMGDPYVVFSLHTSRVAFLFAVRAKHAAALRGALENRLDGAMTFSPARD